MLDQETKKRINDLRDTLVGKVPDPKSQVEQIMIALIFKFMNDMDKESADLGGKASFFVGEFEKFSWSNMFDPRVSGDELVELYSDAIESMDDNPNIPQIFRDIFKNAFIPYKDPETLRLFLKQINDFEYSKDSEQLGDAFEHILNSLSSQGDAGQFRTPRHIIDFIVEIVDPKKDETVLDPASGTSGFLISAFKHIVNSNSEKSSGDLLSAAERKKIMKNINGYDISPDMVRIGLANMYLHGFPEPNVVEYDALTSEDRWSEYYDVILANPPFMTPKGGIRPHNKFGLKSNRAEVLFVDYILTHLKPKGRAGIIVPEGIIFQSGKAYKELRKKLVENGLFAVVSLPSGVFKPYSGVKTSILFVDKSFQEDTVIFSEIKNDGFSLGDQRTPIESNDLPKVLKSITSSDKPEVTNLIDKNAILQTENISLSINTFKKSQIISNHEIVDIEEVCEIYQPKTISQKDLIEDGEYLVYGANGVIGKYDKYNHENVEVLITCRGATCGSVNKSKPFSWITGNAMVCSPKDESVVSKNYLFYLLKNVDFSNVISGSAQPQITRTNLKNFQIPLPPLEKQKEIVDEIDQYQKVIDGARQVVENYKPEIEIDNSWDYLQLGEVVDFRRGPFGGSLKKEIFVEDGYLVYEQFHAINDDFTFERYFINEKKYNEMKNFSVASGDLIISCSGTMGKIAIIPENFKKGVINQALLRLRCSNKVNNNFLRHYLYSRTIQKKYFQDQSGAAIQNVPSVKVLKTIPFPDIPLKIQKNIASKILEEKQIIEQNVRLIENYKNKIDKVISKLYSEEN